MKVYPGRTVTGLYFPCIEPDELPQALLLARRFLASMLSWDRDEKGLSDGIRVSIVTRSGLFGWRERISKEAIAYMAGSVLVVRGLPFDISLEEHRSRIARDAETFGAVEPAQPGLDRGNNADRTVGVPVPIPEQAVADSHAPASELPGQKPCGDRSSQEAGRENLGSSHDFHVAQSATAGAAGKAGPSAALRAERAS